MSKKRHSNGGFKGPSPDIGKKTQFQRGNKAAVGHGRPRHKLISEALRHRLDSEGEADALADRAVKLAKTAKPGTSVLAIKEIADRTEGKSVMAVRVQTEINGEDMRIINELAEKLLAYEAK